MSNSCFPVNKIPTAEFKLYKVNSVTQLKPKVHDWADIGCGVSTRQYQYQFGVINNSVATYLHTLPFAVPSTAISALSSTYEQLNLANGFQTLKNWLNAPPINAGIDNDDVIIVSFVAKNKCGKTSKLRSLTLVNDFVETNYWQPNVYQNVSGTVLNVVTPITVSNSTQSLIVMRDGLLLIEGIDYTVVSASQISFVTAIEVSEVIEIFTWVA